MKKVFSLFLAVVVGLFLIPSFDVSADETRSSGDSTVTVTLTPEQTLALYGESFNALAYTSSSGISSVKFRYLCTSENFYNLDHIVPFVSGWSGSSQNEQIVDNFNQFTYLVYICDATLYDNPQNLFTVQIPFSVSISNISFFRQRLFWSAQDAGFVYSSSLDSRESTFDIYLTDSGIPVSFHPTYFQVYNNGTRLTAFPKLITGRDQMWTETISGTCIDALYQPTDSETGLPQNFAVDRLNLNLKWIQQYRVPSTIEDWLGSTINPVKQWWYDMLDKDVFYLYIACPSLSDAFVIENQGGESEQIDYSEQIDTLIDNTSGLSSNLAAILAKLDAIYAKMNGQGISVSGTVEIGGPSITNIGVAIGSAVGSAIQGLFVPTQADILNFRLGMNTLVSDTFAPFADAQTARDLAVNRILSVSPIAYVDLPLLDLRSSGVDFYIPPETFTNQGFTVQDNKVKVPLKPRENEWGTFYELLKWAIDVVCTIAFVNMLLNKFNGLIVGKKVVEIEDDN